MCSKSSQRCVLGAVGLAVGAVWAATGTDALRGRPSSGNRVETERSWPCPQESQYSQPSDGCADEWGAFTSAIAPDGSFEYTVFENFPPLSGEICGINFYGLSALWYNGWYGCDPAGMVFEITFYAPGDLPAPIVAGPYTVTPSSTLQENCLDVYGLYYFEAGSLAPCCNLPSGGWVSIKSTSAPNDCVFLWMTAPTTYDGQSSQLYDGIYHSLGRDLAFCVPGWLIPYGACCDEYSGICEENVHWHDCLGEGQRILPYGTCDQMTPPCGEATGACCYDSGWCCVATIAVCTRMGDANCDGVVDFNDVNPFVDVLSGDLGCNPCQADCNRDGLITFDDINPFVEIVSGGGALPPAVFLGFGTVCEDCPCYVLCPPGATDEDEECYTDTNGGCSSSPQVWGSIACGETVCGTSYLDGLTRDSDWYLIQTTQSLQFTLTAKADFDLLLMLYKDDGHDCEDYIYWYAMFDPCADAILVSDCRPAGYYYFQLGPQFTTDFGCTPDHPQYWAQLACEFCYVPLGACCRGGICQPNMCAYDCAAMEGTWQGENTTCDPNPCPPPLPGETCANPKTITGLPYDDFDDTCNHLNDYELWCVWPDEMHSRDAVYRFTPAADVRVDVSLCLDESCYDTVLFLAEGGCEQSDLIACDDDSCSTACYSWPYISTLEDIPLQAGHAYYILVDGYRYDCGTYHLRVSETVPCVVDCPSDSYVEQEPCGADTNGGCNMPAPTFEVLPYPPITVCGTAWFDGELRDTDWYEVELPYYSCITLIGEGEADNMVFGFIEQFTPGVPDCANITGYLNPYVVVPKCVEGWYTTTPLPPGVYYLFVGTDFSNIDPCPVDYVITVTTVP